MEYMLFLILLALYLFLAPLIAIISAKNTKQRVDDLEQLFKKFKKDFRKDLLHLQESLAQNPVTPANDIPETKEKIADLEAQAEEKLEALEQELTKTETEATKEKIPSVPLVTTTAQKETSSIEKNHSTPPITKASLEETLGTKWTVWVGGLALALGAIFLVKYSIDQGWFGPEIRMTLAAIFSLALLATGDYLRRNRDFYNETTAYIPGILTGVGIISSFATIYASHALYHFIGPAPAFILLGVISIASLFAAALHGPWLSALGLLASFTTPLFVQSDTSNAWVLFSYLGFVAAISYMLSFLRSSIWIAITATIGSCLWVCLWLASLWKPADILPVSIFILTLLTTVHIFLNRGSENKNSPSTFANIIQNQDWTVILIMIALSALIIPVTVIEGHSNTALIFLTMSTLALFITAWRLPQLTTLSLWTGALFSVIYATWQIKTVTPPIDGTASWHLNSLAPAELIHFLTIGFSFGIFFLSVGYALSLSRKYHSFWAITSTATPIAIMVLSYWKATNFENSLPFATTGYALTALLIVATARASSDRKNKNAFWCSGIFATAAIATLALSCAMLLERGWLTISFSLIALGIAWVSVWRPIPGLRRLTAAIVILTIGRLVWEPTIMAGELGTVPVLNWLLYGYGVPAISFILAAGIYKKQNDDWIVQLLEAASVLFITALISLQIHHYITEGGMHFTPPGIVEFSLHVMSWLGLSLGLQSFKSINRRPVYYYASIILGLVGLFSTVFGLLITHNPMFTGEHLGDELFWNPLILAYLLPSALCFGIYLKSKEKRHPYYTNAFGISAGALMWVYISLEIRRIYQGPVLTGIASTEELYTYSAAWLLFGIALLIIGFWRNVPALRYASCALLVITICKVFLSDMSNLTGILRALSFIGLGITLIAIGYFYQKYVFPEKMAEKIAE